MATTFDPPELNKDAFTCPHCGAYSAMDWESLVIFDGDISSFTSKPIKIATCHRCDQDSIWLSGSNSKTGQMIYPQASSAPIPSADLPPECKKDYLEASAIFDSSPRGAAALLRLCIQKLIVHLGGNGKNINDDIALLVKNGLSPKVQQALDVVRFVGNNAVHPGELSVEDQPQTASALFGLINIIVDSQITQPQHVAALFSSLPQGARDAVSKRDSKA